MSCARLHYSPFHGHSFICIYILYILLKLCDTTTVNNQPLQLRISQDAKKQFEKYKEETCRKNNTFNEINAYLTWEETAFLKELRVTLLPETSHGDYHSIVGTPHWKQIDYRMMDTSVDSLCPKQNFSEEENKDVTEKTLFEDRIINVLLNLDLIPKKKN